MPLYNILLLKDSVSDITLERTLLEHHHQTTVAQLIDMVNGSKQKLTKAYDVIIFNIKRPTAATIDTIRFINQQQITPIIIFADNNDSDETIQKLIAYGVSAYIVDGLQSERINNIIKIALARFKQQQLLHSELEKTKNKLEERKLLDKAKGILIKNKNFTEDQAYHTLRKLAMSRNIPIGEMAKNIITMEDLFD